jgi:quercetin dioxygenase-like cupin family protein
MEFLEDIKSHEFLPGFTGRFVHGAASTLSYVTIKKGSELPTHQHPHEQITHIVEGELQMLIGDTQYVLTPGSVHVIPGNVPHSAYALTDCKVLDFFSPARDDYRF